MGAEHEPRTSEARGVLPVELRERWVEAPLLPLSLVAPVYDEALNLEPLYRKVAAALGANGAWELILVDDGSRDDSARVIRDLCARDPRVKGIFFARNCGQTAAIAAGFQIAAGASIATIDADLQNDPADVPRMVEQLCSGGHDAVVGWRRNRCDGRLRRFSSWVGNGVRRRLCSDTIRDTGCSLKVFRRAPIRALPLFEGMHRFLPTLLRYHGFDVVEIPVDHHPRVAGASKYGVRNRVGRAARDLLAVRWMRRRRLVLPICDIVGRSRMTPEAEEGPEAEMGPA
ncbi:MAG: dolichol-phosphate mannosyltransferase, partial [Planctomycetota bacterium]